MKYVTEELCNEKHKEVDDVKSDIKSIKENHLVHIERDINDMKLLFTRIEVSDNIKNKIIWVIVGAAITSLVAFVLNHFGVRF